MKKTIAVILVGALTSLPVHAQSPATPPGSVATAAIPATAPKPATTQAPKEEPIPVSKEAPHGSSIPTAVGVGSGVFAVVVFVGLAIFAAAMSSLLASG